MISFGNDLFSVRCFSKKRYKQARGCVDIAFKLITNCYQSNNPRRLHYKWFCCGVPQKPFDKSEPSAYLHFDKLKNKRLIKTCFNNF